MDPADYDPDDDDLWIDIDDDDDKDNDDPRRGKAGSRGPANKKAGRQAAPPKPKWQQQLTWAPTEDQPGFCPGDHE